VDVMARHSAHTGKVDGLSCLYCFSNVYILTPW